jgi:hypothetical protein
LAVTSRARRGEAEGEGNLPVLLGLGALAAGLYLFYFTLRFPLPRLYATLPPVDFAKLTHYFWGDSAAYLVVLTVLFAAPILAARALGASPRAPAFIFGGGFLFGLILIPLYPILATDLFSYALRGRVAALYGANPFAIPPVAFPADPWVALMGEWAATPSPYGPLWEALSGVVARWAGEDLLAHLLALKATAFAFYLGSMALLWATLGQVAPRSQVAGALFFAWNPLVLLEAVGNGHNDIVMVAFILLAMRCLVGRRAWGVILSLAAATLVKHVALLLVPPFLLYLAWQRPPKQRWLFLFMGATLLAALLIAAWLPVWPGWEDWAVREATSGATYSPAALLILLLRTALGAKEAFAVGRFTVLLLFALAYLWALRRRPADARQAVRAGYLALLGYLVFAAMQFHPWYLLWVLPLAACLGPRERTTVLVFCWTGLASTVIYDVLWPWYWHVIDVKAIHLIGVSFTFLPPGLVALWRGRRHIPLDDPDPSSYNGG